MSRFRKMKAYTPLWGKKIDIAGIMYKIKYFKTIEGMDPEEEETWDPDAWTAGYTDLSKREIGIFAYLTREEHNFVLLHELTHAAVEAVKTAEIFQKEDFIKPVSRVLFSTLRQTGLISLRIHKT